MQQPTSKGPFPVVGLTGVRNAGKTVALTAFETFGAATLSTDAVVHDLYRRADLQSAVVARWGAGVVTASGLVDREQIATRVFTAPSELHWLEQLLWPLVREQFDMWLQMQANATSPPELAVVEVPLLFESGFWQRCDRTVVVTSPPALQGERTGSALAEGQSRDQRQLSEADKVQRADYVLHNDGSLAQLKQRVGALYDRLIDSSGRGQ